MTFTNLISQPDKYNGTMVTVEGFYFDAFEMEAFCGSLIPSTSNPQNLVPQSTLIWLKGALSDSVYQKLYVPDRNNPTGYPQHYGAVIITGKFESGGKYGHLDQYQYQLTISSGQIIPWTPSN